MKKKQESRETNIVTFGKTSVDKEHPGEWAHYKQGLPKKKKDLDKIIAHICKERKVDGEQTNVSSVHLSIVNGVFDIATRPNLQFLDSVVCPECEELHPIECPECGPHKLDILDSSAEKNSIACLKILSDKFFPNRAPVAEVIDLEGSMEAISKCVGEIMSMLKEEEQKTALALWIACVERLQSENQ